MQMKHNYSTNGEQYILHCKMLFTSYFKKYKI